MADEMDPELVELAKLDGLELGEDGRLRAKMAWNAKAANVTRSE